MASTGIDRSSLPDYSSEQEKNFRAGAEHQNGAYSVPNQDATHRKLKSRHIQLIGIGGTIGTALYVRQV